MDWSIGAPSKRRIKGRLSVTSTAFPTSNAANVAVKKPLNSTPCSSRIRRLVHKIRLKPTKKKIVGGSACFTCAIPPVEGTAQEWRRRRGGKSGLGHTQLLKDGAELTAMPHRLN